MWKSLTFAVDQTILYGDYHAGQPRSVSYNMHVLTFPIKYSVKGKLNNAIVLHIYILQIMFVNLDRNF